MKGNPQTPTRHSVRELHQLRRVPSLRGRETVVRAFLKDGQWGILDGSGAVWPVSLQASSDLTAAMDRVSAWDWIEILVDSDPLQAGGLRILRMLPLTQARDSGVLDRLNAWLTKAVFAVEGYSSQVPFPQLGRHQMIHDVKKRLRRYFKSLGYLELDAPTVVPSGGIERYLQVFETRYRSHHGEEQVFQLPTSPEFALKKCLARGYSKVFSFAQSFRNGGEVSPWHRPEFTMLEWYAVGQSLEDLMDQTWEIVTLVSDVLWAEFSTFSAASRVPFRAETHRMEDLYREHFGIDLQDVLSSGEPAPFYQALLGKSLSIRQDDSIDELFWKSFLDVIEPVLNALPWVFLTGFPCGYASLAQAEPGGVFAKRFELFSRGVEICNGYFELTDVDVMRDRFENILLQRPDLSIDPDFEGAMKAGIPPCAGNALGLERLISVLIGAHELALGHGLAPISSR